jgi:hypothetical protein
VSPYFILAIIIAGLYSSLFIVLKGRQFKDVLFFYLASLLGLAIGQLLGNTFHLSFLMLGPLHLAEITIFAWMMMILANWLKIPQKAKII